MYVYVLCNTIKSYQISYLLNSFHHVIRITNGSTRTQTQLRTYNTLGSLFRDNNPNRRKYV